MNRHRGNGLLVLVICVAVIAVVWQSNQTLPNPLPVITNVRPCSGAIVLDGKQQIAERCGSLAPKGDTVVFWRGR